MSAGRGRGDDDASALSGRQQQAVEDTKHDLFAAISCLEDTGAWRGCAADAVRADIGDW